MKNFNVNNNTRVMLNLFQHLNAVKIINQEMPKQVRHDDKKASYIISI